MSVVSLLKGKGPSGFGFGSTAEDVTHGIDLSGRTILITGCNSGIGFESAQVLALRGAKVLAAARTEEKARATCASMSGDLVPIACELSDPRSVRACVERLAKEAPRLDAIICNAGIMALPKLHKAFGYELQFFTNHIGHFILVTGLLDHLAPEARLVILSSSAHGSAPPGGIQFDNLSGDKSYRGWTAYGQSKLANLLFAKELARRLKGRATANAVHPGVIKTNLSRSMHSIVSLSLKIAAPLFLKTVAEGAATQCYVATHPDVLGITGEYFADCNIARSSRLSRDRDLATRLWETSEQIVSKLPT